MHIAFSKRELDREREIISHGLEALNQEKMIANMDTTTHDLQHTKNKLIPPVPIDSNREAIFEKIANELSGLHNQIQLFSSHISNELTTRFYPLMMAFISKKIK